MKKINPMFIPRNHLVDVAIKTSEKGADNNFLELMEQLSHPYLRVDSLTKFHLPPKADEIIHKTFCGT